jgi:hypothetical protein
MLECRKRLIVIAAIACLVAAAVWSQTTMTQKIPDPKTGAMVDFTITMSQDGSQFTVSLLGKSATFPIGDIAKGTESAYMKWLYAVLAERGGSSSTSSSSPGSTSSRSTTTGMSPTGTIGGTGSSSSTGSTNSTGGQGGTASADSTEKKQAYAFAWQNSYGFWFADGPVQKLSFGEKSMEAALSLVMGRGRSPVKYIPYYWQGVYGGGTLVLLAGPALESYERDIAKLYNYIP